MSNTTPDPPTDATSSPTTLLEPEVAADAESQAPQEAVLDEAVDRGDGGVCAQWLESASTEQTVHAVSAMDKREQARLLALLPADTAAEVCEALPRVQAAGALGALGAVDHEKAAEILEEMTSDDRADLVAAIDEDEAHTILAAMPAEVADETRRLASYEEDAAGGLMLTEFLAFDESMTVRDVLGDMEANAERYRDYNIQYSYVVDASGALKGVIPIRRLLMARRTTPVAEIMVKDPVRVADTTEFDALRGIFDDHGFLALPVVDGANTLLGVVERAAVSEAAREDADDMYRASQGIVGGEELRSMPLSLRSRRRLAWLSINIVLNIIAASVIAFHQDTLEAVIALAVFLPIISDMSGCSGNQAVAVSMRELTLGVARPRDIFRVLLKECSVGIINGFVLGILIGAVAFLWKGNLALSLVVGSALAANTLIAVCIGGGVPLLLKGFKTDPALASGPILTTITDMCGFLIVLTLASASMAYLAPAEAEDGVGAGAGKADAPYSQQDGDAPSTPEGTPP